MSSLIRFKFRNAKESDAVYFEGAELRYESLETAILEKKGLGDVGVGLVISDAQTNQGAFPDSLVAYG
jgi:hypothetical protein